MENDKIFTKMADELRLAKENQLNKEFLMKHMSNIHLLCELFLETGSTEIPKKMEDRVNHTDMSGDITEPELKTMLGKDVKSSKQSHPETDGMSIFDF